MSNIIQYDFQGHLYSFREDGWFNATDAAAKHSKRPTDWLKQDEIQSYIAALAEVLNCDSKSLLETKRGRYNSGTWMHPKLAVKFAQWLDVRFAVWCDLQIDAIIRNGIRAEGNVDLIPLLLRPDASEWERRFEPAYYRALARVTNTRYLGHAGGTPAIYGQITDRWVYGCILPDEVYAELKERRQNSNKMHQWLTDGGRAVLDKQIALVTNVAATSANFADFESRMMMVSARGGQLSFIYSNAA